MHEFQGPRRVSGERFPRGARLWEQYREANLEQYGWTANVVDAGEVTDLEYQIEVTESTDTVLLMSVVFLQARAATRLAHAPAMLADASLDTELVAGSANDGLEFDPATWLAIRF